MTRLRTPEPQQAEILTALCPRSKAVWGYGEAFLVACRPALTVTEDDWKQSDIQIAVQDDNIVGTVQVMYHGESPNLTSCSSRSGRVGWRHRPTIVRVERGNGAKQGS